MFPFLNTAYQKLVESSLIVLGVLGIIFYIRRDAKQDARQTIQAKAYKEFFKNDEEDKKNAQVIDNMHINDIRKLHKQQGDYFPR